MNINDLQPFTSSEEADEYNSGLKTEHFTIDNIPSYIVYSIIRDCLGKSGEEGDDNQWYFDIRVGDFRISLYDKDEFTTYFLVDQKGDEQDKEAKNKIGKEFIDLLSKQASKYNSRLKEAAKTARGYLLSNSFTTYFDDAEKLMQEAEELERRIAAWEKPDPSTSREGLERTREAFENWYAEFKKSRELQPALCRSAFFMFVASFEGFLNLIYELYLKHSLRDERIRERLSREQVDIKLRLAPVYCHCFKSSDVIFKADEFHRFQYIVKLRNDFIHANLTSSMKIPFVEVDDYSFALPTEKSGKYNLPYSLTNINTGHLRFVSTTITDMVQAVITSMAPRYKHEIETVLHSEEIYVKIIDEEYIITM